MIYFFKIYDASMGECKDLSLTGCWLRDISYGSYINKHDLCLSLCNFLCLKYFIVVNVSKTRL